MTTIESGNLPDRLFFMSMLKRGVPTLYVYKNGFSFREGKGARDFGELCAWLYKDI